jgi:hypothetical protein
MHDFTMVLIYSCAIIKMVDPLQDDNQNQAMMDMPTNNMASPKRITRMSMTT